MKQNSNNKLIRKQIEKHVLLSSSDSLQHNSDSNVFPRVGTLSALSVQMWMAEYCNVFTTYSFYAMRCTAQYIPVAFCPASSGPTAPLMTYSLGDSRGGTPLPNFPLACTFAGCGSRGWLHSTSLHRTAGLGRRPGVQHSMRHIQWIINVFQEQDRSGAEELPLTPHKLSWLIKAD